MNSIYFFKYSETLRFYYLVAGIIIIHPVFSLKKQKGKARGLNEPIKIKGQTPKSDIPPNIAPKIVTSENYLRICDSSAMLIGQLAIVTLFGAILGGIPLSGPYPLIFYIKSFTKLEHIPLVQSSTDHFRILAKTR